MFQVSGSSIHNSPSRSHGLKSSKLERGRSKLFSQKKSPSNKIAGTEDKMKNKESFTIKEEPLENVKEEFYENDLQPLEAENTIQHSDILTSLQMIPVVKKTPVEVVKDQTETIDEPIETSKILAAMREAMMDSEDKIINKSVSKPVDKKKKIKSEEKSKRYEAISDVKKTETIDGNVIICNGCGMQFDNSSACQRHKKKCVYWKEDKNSENTRNKCSNCGLMFPYLMALLRHDCLKVEVADEPSMPELCPEKPVEEMQYSGADDIPILSPAEVSRDDVQTRRMSLAEAVVKEVSIETFDVSDYQNKWCSSPIKTKQKSPNGANENPGGKAMKAHVNKLDKDFDKVTEGVKTQILEEKPTSVSSTSFSPSLSKKPLKKVLSPQNKPDVIKNKKVSDIFKEVKRRGRKRQKPLTKVALRRTGMTSLVVSKKKPVLKKSRSSNFVMLMKEWEKLEKEGAVAVGKRKRQCSDSKINFGYVHRSRRLRTININNERFDIESSTYDSSIPDSEIETFTKKTRRPNTVETLKDDFQGKNKKESKKLVFSGKVKTEKEDDEEVEPLKKKSSIAMSIENDIVDDEISVSLVKEERDEIIVKRKPGRPRYKNITFETVEHINETIDSIIMRSLENQAVELSNDSFTSRTDLGQPLEPLLLTEKPEDSKSELEENQMKINAEEPFEWSNVVNTIYNVSIGDAESFSSSSSNLDIHKVERRKKMSFNDLSEQTSISGSVLNLNNSSVNNVDEKEKCLDGDNKTGKNSKSTKVQNQLKEVFFDGMIENIDNGTASCSNTLNEKKPCPQTIRGKRKLSFSEEERSATSLKRKEVKTKQLSIADYLSISQFVNRSSSSLNTQGNKNDSVEKKPNHKLLNTNKIDKISNDNVQIAKTVSPKNGATVNVPCLSEVPMALQKVKKDSNVLENKIKVRSNSDLCVDERPSSPGSISSTEDVALSVIRDKVIQKKKKRLKMKKLLKKKQLLLVDNKTLKITKPKLVISEGSSIKKDKVKKVNKKIKVDVSRNRWEVSVVDNKNKPVEVFCEDNLKQAENSNNLQTVQTKKFYCATCDQKYESSYALYQHQSTSEHKRNTLLAEQQRNATDDNDPVKYCKSIGNIINDLEKRTLNVAKVMYQLKQSEPASEAPAQTESSSAAKDATDWSRCPTPSWETQQQAWEVDSFSTGSSLGSIMDTVNKVT